MKTNIQWTDLTDNIFVVEGGGWFCQKISPGCANCYAEKINGNSFYGGNGLSYKGEPPKIILRRDILDGWKRQTKPKRHFVSSMTDIFGEWIPPIMMLCFLDAMLAAPMQTFQMLTKRDLVAMRTIRTWLDIRELEELPAHMWIGVSIENQELANERIPNLLKIPAKVRFLSVEPMLGPVDLHDHFLPTLEDVQKIYRGEDPEPSPHVHWVIFGGESGPKARPCNVEWIRAGAKQCRAAGVPVFVKQLGTLPYQPPGGPCRGVLNDPKGGDPAEWPDDLRIREFPTV